MTLQKLSLSLSEMGLCPFPTQYGAGAFSEEAALQLFTMQLRSLGDYLHRARLPEGTSCCPSAEQQHFASCFQNLRVSNCAAARSLLPCEDKKRSSSRGQPDLLSPRQQRTLGELGTVATSCFFPFTKWIQSSCFTTGKVKENHCQPALDYSITTRFPFVPSPMKIPRCKLIITLEGSGRKLFLPPGMAHRLILRGTDVLWCHSG